MVLFIDVVELKLKQASAVLGVTPKDIQNLVQFKVLRPSRRDSVYWFNNRLLLEAKVALYLKDSLGTSTDILTLFARALSRLSDEQVSKSRFLSLRSRPAKGREPVEIRIPIRDLANELKEQIPTAAKHQDLRRGRKRSAWKRDFTRALESASKDLSNLTETQIADAVRGFRAGKKALPEITIGPFRATA